MFIKTNNQGQGLVEVIIAVAIIITGIISVMTLTFSSLSSSETSVKQVVAANLAREGVEVVRNIRDTNWLKDSPSTPVDWLAGLSSGADRDGIAEFDPTNNSWTINFKPNNISEVATKLYRDSNNVYTHDNSGTDSGYKRFIQMWEIYCQHQVNGTLREIVNLGQTCNANENVVGIKVLSTVEWQEKSGVKQFKVEENIYNWHDAR